MAIHAGQRWHQQHADQIQALGIDVPPRERQVFGAILCVARIVDCVHELALEGLTLGDRPERVVLANPWFSGPYGWILDEVQVLAKPIPCRGALGLWKLPPDVDEAVRYTTRMQTAEADEAARYDLDWDGGR